ncbi:MAG: hypothetical protein LC720_01590 [Actinobacteria bacterium]|nr:hypothetical protein [Actinomycetota bacterium]
MIDQTQEFERPGTPDQEPVDRRMREAVERARTLAIVGDSDGYVVPPVDTRGGPTDDIAPAPSAYPGIPGPLPAPEGELRRRDAV